MKNTNLKAFAYSLLLSAIFILPILLLNRAENLFISALILAILLFTCFMIILWNNKPMIFYFWKGRDDFITAADRMFCVLLGTIMYISARYVVYTYQDEGSIDFLACFMCLTAALSFRRIYLNHAPDDIEQYEKMRKLDEDVNTFVTVAECKDVESAHIIKSMLESNNIETITYGESSPEYIGYVPVRVLVRKKDREAAEKLVNE